MTTSESTTRTRAQEVGWWIVLVISALMLLNGVVWFFVGPGNSLAYTAKVAGMSAADFTQLYPEVVAHHTRTTLQVAVWYTAFGAMALIVALEGLRHGARWAWNATWAVVAAPIAIGIVYTPGGQVNAEGGFLIAVGVITLVGQLMARRRQSRQSV